MSLPPSGNQPIGNAVGQVQQVYGGSMGGLTSAVLGTDPGSGGWEFTADELESVINKWEDLLDDVKEDRHKIRDLLAIFRTGEQPSDDDPTTNYHERVIDGVKALKKSNDSMLSYVDNYIESLRKAKKKLEESDADARDSLSSTEV